MRFAYIAGAFLIVGFAEAADPNRLVKRTDFAVPAAWAPKGLGGYGFLPMFRQVYWANARCTNAPLPMYRACVVQSGGYDKLSRNDLRENGDAHVGNYARWLKPEEKHLKPYAFKDAFGTPWSAACGMTNRADGGEYPFFVQLPGDRPSFFLNREYPLADKASYWAWRAQHPNYLGARTLGEYDQQAMWYEAFSRINKDASVSEHLQKAFPFAPPGTPRPIVCRDWFPKWVRECWAREEAYYFGETNLWTLCSGCPSLQHVMGEMGASGFSYEATTQGAGSWTVPGAITRGAARQFGVPFGWYGANFITAYTREGKRTSGENSMAIVPDRHYKAFGKYKGASRSLIRRQLTYGWLIGAAFVEPENWYHYHMEETAPGQFVPSAYAKDLQALVNASATIDRGASYAPLAVLVPLWERHERGNWDRDLCDPWSFPAVCLTLEPPNQEQNDVNLFDLARRRGDESCFFNSPFGGVWDVLAPDATRTRATIAKTLGAYKAALVAGDFRKAELPPRLFENYAAQGGTLFVSADKIVRGVVDAAAAGVAFGKATAPSGKTLLDARTGKTVAELSLPYDVMPAEGKPTAQPLYRDENGNVLVWSRTFGRGRIVTVACDRMLPRAYAKCAHGDYKARLLAAAQPGFRFDLLHALLARVQEETVPVKVEGDVQWGVNRTATGWFVWLFNNKGVVKFIGEPEELDGAKTAHVTVRCGRAAKTLSVGPGGMAYATFAD